MEKNRNTGEVLDSGYYEVKRHTDTMFAFNIYPCAMPVDFTFVPLHWQDSVEIIYVKRGKGIVQVDQDAFTAEAGDIFLALPGHLHGMHSIPRQRMEYENIIFDIGFLSGGSIDICSRKYLQPMAAGKIRLPVRIGKGDSMYGQIAACLDDADRLCASRPAGYEMGVKGRILLLFAMLFGGAGLQEEQTAEKGDVQKLKTVLARIERDYGNRLTVRDMAEECGYSESHFMRWFKENTGIGFAGYLIEYRLEKAALALRNSRDTVLQISEQAGFDNLSNFNRLFKKRFETTPSRFRKDIDTMVKKESRE